MKRIITALILLALATGCGQQPSPPSTQNTSQQPTNTANADNGTTTNSTASDSSGSDAQLDAELKQIAGGLVDAYVRSHNDKTLQEYQADLQQILIPGFATVVAQNATKGLDYDHPVQSYKVTVTKVTYVDPQEFRADATVHIQFKGEPPQTVNYHLWLFQSNQQWFIRSIA